MISSFKENLDVVKKKIIEIGNDLVKANEIILDGLQNCNQEKFYEARDTIRNTTPRIDDIDNEIIKILALYSPEAVDLRRVIAYFKITNEIARACSNTRSFVRKLAEVCDDLDVQAINEYTLPMQTSTIKTIKNSIVMVGIEDIDELQEMYEDILFEENETDDLYEMTERQLIIEAENHTNSFEKFYKIIKAFRKSEKIADRAKGIAKLLVYIKIGGSIEASKSDS